MPDGNPAALGQAPPQTTELVVEDIVRIADRLFEVFEADSAEQRVASLDSLLSRAAPMPHVELQHSLYMLTWEVRDPVAAVEGSCAVALSELVVGNPESAVPLGICDADACADVYIDRSRGRGRRYCSIRCQNRTKVAAFRARHRVNR